MLSSVGDDGALDIDTVGEKRHVWDGELVVGDRQGVDGGTSGEQGDDLLPVGLSRGGDEETGDHVCWLEVFVEVGRGDELVGSKVHGLGLLPVGPGQDNDSASKLGSELDGEMA